MLASLRDVCDEVIDDPAVIGEASRDWWPLAMTWALQGQVRGARPRWSPGPSDADQVAAVLAVCNERRHPGHRGRRALGRLRRLGARCYGGVVLDLCAHGGHPFGRRRRR